MCGYFDSYFLPISSLHREGYFIDFIHGLWYNVFNRDELNGNFQYVGNKKQRCSYRNTA